MGPPHILYILLTALRAAGALRVSMKTSPMSALRGQDVTIPCNIYELNLQRPMAILWIKRLDNGTEHNVYKYEEGNVVITRPGAHMDKVEIKRGNASLYIPQIQVSDEGEYICRVINTPNKEEGMTSLEVSVPPLADVTPLHPIIQLGTEKTMTCDVYNFYPQDISIRWVEYRKDSTDREILDNWTCVKNLLVNSDGTYNVTSLLTLNPKKDDHDNRYSCLISHRSLQSELSRNFTLTVSEREDNVTGDITAVIISVIVTLLLVAFLALLGFLYHRFQKDVPPILVSIMGPEYVIHGVRVTLTCKILGIKPLPLSIIWMKRDREHGETVLVTWYSKSLTTDKDHEETALVMWNGELPPTDKARYSHDVEMDYDNDNSHTIISALTMTANIEDNGATYICRTYHPATQYVAEEGLTLRVIGLCP